MYLCACVLTKNKYYFWHSKKEQKAHLCKFDNNILQCPDLRNSLTSLSLFFWEFSVLFVSPKEALSPHSASARACSLLLYNKSPQNVPAQNKQNVFSPTFSGDRECRSVRWVLPVRVSREVTVKILGPQSSEGLTRIRRNPWKPLMWAGG